VQEWRRRRQRSDPSTSLQDDGIYVSLFSVRVCAHRSKKDQLTVILQVVSDETKCGHCKGPTNLSRRVVLVLV
jgi:hypothetical protein